MKPTLWGPHMWYILHIITFDYPNNPTSFDKIAYRDFFTNLKNILPCKDCRKHYNQFITDYPITPHLDRKTDLVKWLIQIHNFVNQSLGKKEYSTKEVINFYNEIINSEEEPPTPFSRTEIEFERMKLEDYSQKKQKSKKSIIYLIIILLTIIIIYLRYTYNKKYYYYN